MKLAGCTVIVALAATALAAPGRAAIYELSGGSWKDYGWRRGTPTIAIGGTRIAAPAKNASASIPSSRELVRATVAIDGGGDGTSFLVDARPGHRYLVSPDPDCFLTVTDLDGELAKQARCARKNVCPAGMVEVDKFVYRKDGCGDQPTCAPPAMLRVVGGDVTIEWDGGDAERFGASYRPVGVGREQPQQVIVRRKGDVVLGTAIVVHHGSRYTLSFDATGAPHVAIDGVSKS
jgi:hypothetical protein